MKRLSVALAVSFFVHALMVAVLFSWNFFSEESPLTGGGGGRGVTVEIVGGSGPRGEVVPEIKDSDGPKIAAKAPPRKSKHGRPGGDDVPVAPLEPAGPTGPGQGFGPAGPGSGEGGTHAILSEIRARIERAKRYPLMARRMNIEGVSHVRFAIDASGQPQGLALKASSGSSVLDEEALSTIRRAAPFPAYEEPLEIGIRFEIEK